MRVFISFKTIERVDEMNARPFIHAFIFERVKAVNREAARGGDISFLRGVGMMILGPTPERTELHSALVP